MQLPEDHLAVLLLFFVECPFMARIGTRVAAPEPTGSWSLAAVAAVPIRHLNFPLTLEKNGTYFPFFNAKLGGCVNLAKNIVLQSKVGFSPDLDLSA